MRTLLRRSLAGSLLAFALGSAPSLAAVFVVDSNSDASDANPGDAICDDGSGACSLRAAIDEANTLVGPDRIEFAIASGAPTIFPASFLTIGDELVVDGYTQPGASPNTLAVGTNAVVEIVIDGGGEFGPGIFVVGANVVLRGIAVRNFEYCLELAGGDVKLLGSRVEDCGTTGVAVSGSPVRIGDLAADARNVIASNGIGVQVGSAGNFVVGNLVGTDAAGMAARPNTIGIQLADGSTVKDNLISGNDTGVLIEGINNKVLRNRIGTTANGTAALKNRFGVDSNPQVPFAANNQIGAPSSTKSHANLISGNDYGIRLRGVGGSFVQGNYIGTGPLGVGAVPNDIGVEIVDSANHVIGALGHVAPTNEGNLIAHNRVAGINVPTNPLNETASTSNSLRGNRLFDNAFDIDLGGDGLINDDPGDHDFGPNELLNPPRIQAVFAHQGATDISGVIEMRLGGTYSLDFYASTACDAAPDSGNGEFYLGSASVTANPTQSDPLTPFNVRIHATAQGDGISGMTSDFLQSSELGACVSPNSQQSRADVVVTIDPVPKSLDPGDLVNIRVQVRNKGPFDATDVPVFVPPPPAVGVWLSASPTLGVFDSGSSEWPVSRLVPGATAVLDLTATIAATAAGPVSFEAVADQGLTQIDADLTDNRASVWSVVRAGADLVLSLTPPARGAPLNGAVDFDIQITNRGPETARSVALAGALAKHLEIDLSVAPAGLSYDATKRRWRLPLADMAEGASVSVQVRALIDLATPIPRGLRHSVSASGTPTDPSPATASAFVGVPLAADVAIDRLSWRDGQTYVASISNHGPDAVATFFLKQQPAVATGNIGPYSLAPGESLSYTFDEDIGFRDDPVTLTIIPMGYFDVSPSNDSAYAQKTPRIQCGLLGIEAPVFLGIVALMAGRRGTRLRRLFHLRGAALAALALLSALVPAGSASAAPITFATDSVASSATVSLATPLGTSAGVLATLSGSVAADVMLANDPLFGLHAESMHLANGSIALSNTSILLEDFGLFSLTFSSQDLVADLSGPASNGFAVAPGLSVFDVFGSQLTFGSGTVGATGEYFGLPVNESLDLATFPFVSFFPLNSIAEARVIDLGGGQVSVELRIPFSAPLSLAVDDTQNTLTIAGTLVLRGTTVPEPELLALAAIACFGAARLAATGARRLARRTGERSLVRRQDSLLERLVGGFAA